MCEVLGLLACGAYHLYLLWVTPKSLEYHLDDGQQEEAEASPDRYKM
jgi:hypothetical protein